MSARRTPPRSVAVWLAICCAFVVAMVVVGGLTRLSRAGLSIVDWRPLSGIVPPIGEAAWRAELARYQTSPEGRLVHVGIDVAAFRNLYYIEWAHRLLGRITGVVVLLPLAWFVFQKRLSPRLGRLVLVLFALGGLQGFVGWWMVRSGLVDAPHVSHHRLAVHLVLAIVLAGALLLTTLETFGVGASSSATPTMRRGVEALLALVLVTIVYGALMAGLRAGLVAPTFPTMLGSFVPVDLRSRPLEPTAFLDDPMLVHFIHRCLAYATALSVTVVAWSLRRTTPRLALALALLTAAQVTLGALVVLGRVPITLASLHQLDAIVLLGVVLTIRYRLRVAVAQPERAEADIAHGSAQAA